MSPYLKQHAHNPVDWYPWCDEAFEKAKKENKLVIISIGYSACHWCHVMEKEAFIDEATAKIMNKNYVCVKVDREERPDVDHIYMDAVQIMTGRGGWPLNVFTLPDGRPVYGGTYFPLQQWQELCIKLSKIYIENPGQFTEYASKLSSGIQMMDETESINQKTDNIWNIKVLNKIFQNLKNSLDNEEGGLLNPPKFPMPYIYLFLLRYYVAEKEKDALEHIRTTLEKMASGGIYDQAGGGFARYSTDDVWKVPHFEKMLYDNALLLSVYSQAYRLTANETFKEVAEGIFDFAVRELFSDDKAFYSAIDADSEGEEGKFYVWNEKEIDEALGNDSALAKIFYGVSTKGYWENGNNILVKAVSEEEICDKFNLKKSEFKKKIKSINKKLLGYREKRIRPATDDKILTSWNALMISGLVDAYKAFGDEKYLNSAKSVADYLNKNLIKKNIIYRISKPENKSIHGFLDDYANTIQAFLDLYEVTFDLTYLEISEKLLQKCIADFSDEKDTLFYYTGKYNEKLIARKKEFTDGVMPSSNSVMALNLFRTGKLLMKQEYVNRSRSMLEAVMTSLNRFPAHYANWLILLANFSVDFYEMVISGKNASEKLIQIEKHYFPFKVIAASDSDNSKMTLLQGKFDKNTTKVFLCTGNVCERPFENINEVIGKLSNF